MSDEAAVYANKVRRAAQALLFQRHRMPGVKGWELRRILGRNYLKVMDLLNANLEGLGLKVKVLKESAEGAGEAGEESWEKARFFITLNTPPTVTDVATSGWRIDDVAVLGVAVAYITSKQGKAPRKEVEELLKEKIPAWRVDIALDRFIRRGYLHEDEKGMLHLDWRARAEIDQKLLTKLLLSASPETASAREE
ncbi:MAG: hypothetical protein ACE5PO_02460 [Candidatus Bathyarchaeia archaeon]